MFKYQVPNQLTGVAEEVNTFEEAKELRQKFIDDYVKHISPAFSISILVQNEDGSWTQSQTDSDGNAYIEYVL